MSNQPDVLNALVPDTLLELAHNSITSQHASNRSTPGFCTIEQALHALGISSPLTWLAGA